MSRQFLADHIWHDPEGTTYIMLDVTDKIDRQEARVVDSIELLPKDEYHVSLVPTRKLTDDVRLQHEIVEDVRTYLQHAAVEVRFDGLAEDRYLCRYGDEATLIAPAYITGLEELRRIVQGRVPSYEPAFPHVTLLKNTASKYGIGINSAHDLSRLCQKLI